LSSPLNTYGITIFGKETEEILATPRGMHTVINHPQISPISQMGK